MDIFKKPETLFLIAIIAFSLFFRIKIIHDLPAGTSTTSYGLQGFDDEPAHFNYTRYLLENRVLPVEKHTVADSNAFEINQFEYHQPPLYYLGVAFVCAGLDISEPRAQLLTGRYINLLLALLSFFVIYLLFMHTGWSKEQSFLGLSFIALLGSHVYQTSLFGNDMLSWLLLWFIFYWAIKKGTAGWLLITVLLSLAHYSKTNVLVLYPVLLWILFTDIKEKRPKAISRSVTILIVPVLLALPWYLRNYELYGSFLLLSGSQWHFVSGYLESFTKIISAPYSFLFRMHFLPAKVSISLFNYLQYLFVFALAAGGIITSMREIKNNFNMQVFLLMLLTMIAAYLWLAIPTGFTEGRMLYPALPVIAYFVIRPLAGVIKSKGLPSYAPFAILMAVFIPPYIIGFYY